MRKSHETILRVLNNSLLPLAAYEIKHAIPSMSENGIATRLPEMRVLKYVDGAYRNGENVKEWWPLKTVQQALVEEKAKATERAAETVPGKKEGEHLG